MGAGAGGPPWAGAGCCWNPTGYVSFTPSHGWWGEDGGAGGSACRPDSNPRPSSCRPVKFWAGGLCGHRPLPHLGSRKWHGASPCHTARQAPTPPPGGRALSLQSSTQEIGEELVNGVIYSISLRKVQVHHGANKGQRWLGVSVDGGVSVPRTPTRPGMQGPPWPLHWAPSQGFPAWGAPSPAPKGIWALSPPLLSSPGLGQVHSSLFTYLYEHQKKTLPYYFHFILGWDYLCILPQYFLF